MNALPGRMLVDLGAPDGQRAQQLWQLCHELASLYFPRHEDRARSLARQLAFTAWHLSDHATRRGGDPSPQRSIFGLEPEMLKHIVRDILRPVYRHDLERFLRVTGTSHDTLRRVAPQALLELSVADDLLASALAAEVYRQGGPLPWRMDPRACGETWFSRYSTERGPERIRLKDLRVRAFAADAEGLLRLLD